MAPRGISTRGQLPELAIELDQRRDTRRIHHDVWQEADPRRPSGRGARQRAKASKLGLCVASLLPGPFHVNNKMVQARPAHQGDQYRRVGPQRPEIVVRPGADQRRRLVGLTGGVMQSRFQPLLDSEGSLPSRGSAADWNRADRRGRAIAERRRRSSRAPGGRDRHSPRVRPAGSFSRPSLEDRRNRGGGPVEHARRQDAEVEDRDIADPAAHAGHLSARCGAARRAGLRARHVHHHDDAQVEEDRDDAGQHADDREPV